MLKEIEDELGKMDVGDQVKRALERLLELDGFLLTVDANERSITHRLAMHLQQEFYDWHVDCEYNRDGHDPKELSIGHLEPDEHDTQAQTVFPDIIVHIRGRPENLLVIEIKKSTSKVPADKDMTKLVEYQRQLGYRFALFLELLTSANRPDVSRALWIEPPASHR